MFLIRKSKMLKNQEVPIYLRITVDGERAEISIKRSIHPTQWHDLKGCAKPSAPYSKELNHYLEQIRHSVYEHQKELIDRNKDVTATSLKNALLNGKDDEKRTVLQVYLEHNEDLRARIDKGVSKATFIRHQSSRNNLQRFIKAVYKRDDFYLKDVNQEFISKYESFLRTKRNCNNNSTVKYIKNFGKIVKIAFENEWIKIDPLKKIKLKLEEVDKPFLNEIELQKIISKNLPIPRTAHVRDVFVFCCFTGLAFVDVKSLSAKDIETGKDGDIWIKKQRHKTKQWAHVLLLPPAKQILEKYKSHPECIRKGVLLPVLTNQKMNSYLKEVADICGISKNLTTHCARHTFATTVTLANGISIESTSKMLGHSSIRMTQRYARILDSTIGQEMNQLAGKLSFQLN